jgi:DNA modification methylase
MAKFRNSILCGEALALLKTLPDASVNTIITSPPYYSVRDYGTEGQLGLEQTPELYIERLVAIFHEAWRVLRDDGCVFVNLGDSYWGGKGQSGSQGAEFQQMRVETGVSLSKPAACIGGNGKTRPTDRTHADIRAKSLIGIPARFALAMQQEGWIWRSNAPWIKDTALPESVTDRPTKTIEWIMLFVKSPKYWWDATAVRQSNSSAEQLEHNLKYAKPYAVYDDRVATSGQPGNVNNKGIHERPGGTGRNFRDTDFFHAALDAEIEATMLRLRELQALKRKGLVTDEHGDPLLLHVNPEPSSIAHYAMYPTALVRPMILAGCPEKVCATCGKPWTRKTENEPMVIRRSERGTDMGEWGRTQTSGTMVSPARVTDLGLSPACTCHAPTHPGLVLDLFGGTGTTGLVARELGRDYLLFDLSAEYCAIMEQRLGEPFNLPLLAQTTAPEVETQLSLFD